jgi:hypothetical protein
MKSLPNKILRFAVPLLALCLVGQGAFAAVSAEEAAQLKTSLTPMGAEKAGNADGSIPAWDGGYTRVPAGYQNGALRPDVFAGEKPVLSITAKNLEQYKDKLAVGAQVLLKKYPDFRVDVYPSHRTAAAPQWVYDNTFKNATRAKLTDNKLGATGAYGGIPFPIVKDGYEAIMNHRLSWAGVTIQQPMKTMVVTPDGKLTMATEAIQTIDRPYYYPEGSVETYDGIYQNGRLINTAPAFKAGEAILVHEVSDESKPRGIWQYLVGQRRVRRAPSISHDTPDFVTSGIGLADEAFMLFGPLDYHDLKLVGKKEMYIPYNNNRAAATPYDKLMLSKFLNPDDVRWELHRVWVVEATLKEGKRHVVPKRYYYIDEDSWQIVLIDDQDAQGEPWRFAYSLMLLCPDVPAVVGDVYWGSMNLQTGAYLLNEAANDSEYQFKVIDRLDKNFFSPNTLANRGGR